MRTRAWLPAVLGSLVLLSGLSDGAVSNKLRVPERPNASWPQGPSGAESSEAHSSHISDSPAGSRWSWPNPPKATTPRGNGPPALYRDRPSLPAPSGWPFSEAFPTVSGTGASTGTAILWTDFIYDDRGASGVPVARSVTPFAPTHGTYEYAVETAANNGADIFRLGIGRDGEATFWRVDWNTLIDERLPMAIWGFDTDASATTGTPVWPANASVTSPGLDVALVVSAAGAWITDPVTGTTRRVGAVAVDRESKSFVARLPRDALPVSGRWRVRAISGVADTTGTSLDDVSPSQGAPIGGPPVYNVGFRTPAQERPLLGSPRTTRTMNHWMEGAQAASLTAADVSRFYIDVDWSEMVARHPEPGLETGWLNRWYVSSVELGDGVVRDSGTGQDGRPNYLGRVQPYALYVPTSYDGSNPVPLTWLLHSAFQGHNAFGAVTPRFVEHACEKRKSICVTPLGRGHDGWYLDEAELDFWEVWNDVAATYRLDPERTVIAGFSMGGYAAYRLAFSHPDLFASAVSIGATPTCGERLAAGVERPAAEGRCATDGNTTPMVENARWIPYYVSHGTTDELLPITGTLDQVGRFDSLGLRYRFDHYVGQPHIPWYLQDSWAAAAEAMGDRRREVDPPAVTLGWYPNAGRPDLGTGVTGAYWIAEVVARDASPGEFARIDAHSAAIAQPEITPVRSTEPVVFDYTTPAVSSELTWQLGPTRPTVARIDLSLHNVATLKVNVTRAGIGVGELAVISVHTDGPGVVVLGNAAGPVYVDGRRVGTATPAHAFIIELRHMHHTIKFGSPTGTGP